MPENNTKVLEEKNVHLWFSGSPIVVCSMKLVLDIQQCALFAYGKFMNVQPDNLNSVVFDVICYNNERIEIDRITDIAFTGLDVMRNIEFGYNRAIPIRLQDTRSVEFVLKSITNTVGQSWTNREYKRFNKALQQKSIFDIQKNLNKHFLEVCSRNGISSTKLVHQPLFERDHWMCACGTFNWNNERNCSDCGTERTWLQEVSDLEYLQKMADIKSGKVFDASEYDRRAAEDKRRQREEFEQRNKEYGQSQKKYNLQGKTKKLIIGSIVAVIVLVLVGGLVFFGMPYFQYMGAKDDMNSGKYDSAISTFQKLNGFMDSEQLITSATYAKADSLYLHGQKQEAADVFKSLGTYSGSADRYNKIRYEIAEQNMTDKKYIAAADIYQELANYEKSSDNLKKCFTEIYKQGQVDLQNKQYDSAYTAFRYLGDFRGAEQFLQKTVYAQGKEAYSKMHYAEALKKYKEAGDFADAKKELKNLKALSYVLSAASDNAPAVWTAEGTACALCNGTDSATYTLAFSNDGKMTYKIDCKNHPENIATNVEYHYKIENHTVYRKDIKDASQKWQTWLNIKSINPLNGEVEGKSAMMIISNPANPKKDATFYGNIVSEDKIDF